MEEFSQSPWLWHLWNFGYKSCAIQKVWNDLPPHLNLSIRRFMYLLEKLAQISSFRLKDSFLVTGCKGYVPASFYSNPDIAVALDECEDLGLIIVTYDPQNQYRQIFAANQRAARFWGLTKLEFMKKLKQRKIPMRMTELDWIRSFAAYIARYFDDAVAQFVRFTACGGVDISGNTLECRLVCIQTTKCYDAFGRIAQESPKQFYSCNS